MTLTLLPKIRSAPRRAHVTYDSSATYRPNVMANVEVFMNGNITLIFDLDIDRCPLLCHRRNTTRNTHVCEIRKLYQLPFKSYGQCQSVRTNGVMDKKT